MDKHQGIMSTYPSSTYPSSTYPSSAWTTHQSPPMMRVSDRNSWSLPSFPNHSVTNQNLHNQPPHLHRDLRSQQHWNKDREQLHYSSSIRHSGRNSQMLFEQGGSPIMETARRETYPQASKEEMDYIFDFCCSDKWSEVLNMIMKSPWFALTPIVMGNNIMTTVLHQAITKRTTKSVDRIHVIKNILHYTPQAASVRNGYGSLPLHAICQRNIRIDSHQKEDLIRAFIHAYPGSVAVPGGVGKRTPLHIIFTDYYSAGLTYEMIRAAPIACSMKDKKGYLPAHVACSRHCSPEKLLMLLDVYPQALHETTNDGHTLLSLAETTSTISHPNHSLIDEIKKQLYEENLQFRNTSEDVQWSANPLLESNNNSGVAARRSYHSGRLDENGSEMRVIDSHRVPQPITESDKSCSTESCSRSDETLMISSPLSGGQHGGHYGAVDFNQIIPTTTRYSKRVISDICEDFQCEKAIPTFRLRSEAKIPRNHQERAQRTVWLSSSDLKAKKVTKHHYPPRTRYSTSTESRKGSSKTFNKAGTSNKRTSSTPVDLLLHFSRTTGGSHQVVDDSDGVETNYDHLDFNNGDENDTNTSESRSFAVDVNSNDMKNTARNDIDHTEKNDDNDNDGATCHVVEV